jgi:hypothetical protein
MNEEFNIVPYLVGAVGLIYFANEVEKRRHRLRLIFDVFDKEESKVASALERMVESGQLRPYLPNQPAPA